MEERALHYWQLANLNGRTQALDATEGAKEKKNYSQEKTPREEREK